MAGSRLLPVSNTKVITSLRMVQLLFGSLSLVYLWRVELPWQAMLDGYNHAQPLPAAQEPKFVELFSSPAGDTSTKKKSFTETLSESIGGSICFLMSFMLLYRNEGHSVRMDQLFALAAGRVKELPEKLPGVPQVDTENLRELISVQGETSTNDVLTLDFYSVTAPASSTKLRARVWMYQWKEEEKNRDNATVYEYKKVWMNQQIDSKSFHRTAGHENPTCPLNFLERRLANTTLGDFRLPQRVLGQMQSWSPCELSKQLLEEIGQKISRQGGIMTTHKEQTGLARPNLPVAAFKTGEHTLDEVGDLRVSIEYVPCGALTVLGVQVQSEGDWTFVPMQYVEHGGFLPNFRRANTTNTNLGDRFHQTLLGEDEKDVFEDEARNAMDHLALGVKAAMKGIPNPITMTDNFLQASARDEILYACEARLTAKECLANLRGWEKKLGNAIRLFGVILMFVSCQAMFSPLRWIFAHVWLIGAALNVGITLASIMCTCCCSTLAISTAWIFYRPLMVMVLVILSGSFIFYAHEMSEPSAARF